MVDTRELNSSLPGHEAVKPHRYDPAVDHDRIDAIVGRREWCLDSEKKTDRIVREILGSDLPKS